MDVRQPSTQPCTLEKLTPDGWEAFANLTLCPPLVRMGENGIPQYTADGGTTWTDFNSPPVSPVPPGGTGTNRCLAAHSATAVLEMTYEEFRRQYNSGVSVLVATALILSILISLWLFPAALRYVITFAAELWGLFTTLGQIPFDSDARTALQCILYCNSSEVDGVVYFDHAAVVEDVQELMGGTPDIYWAIFYLLMFIGGEPLARAGATGLVTSADCSACDCADTAEFEIPSTGAFVPFTFVEGREYTITTTGTFSYGAGQTADAVAVDGQINAYYALNWGLSEQHVQNDRFYPTSPIHWDTHSYVRTFTGDGLTHYFYIMDDEAEYGNNSGSLSMLIEWDTGE
jgi:hypothetical protein